MRIRTANPLEKIQAFIGAGWIRLGSHKQGTKPCYSLVVGRHEDVLRVLENMQPHLIVKKTAAMTVIEYIRRRDWRPVYPRFTADRGELEQRYNELGLSGAARFFGVSTPTIHKYLVRNSIPRTYFASLRGP